MKSYQICNPFDGRNSGNKYQLVSVDADLLCDAGQIILLCDFFSGGFIYKMKMVLLYP